MHETSAVSFSGVFALRDGVKEEAYARVIPFSDDVGQAVVDNDLNGDIRVVGQKPLQCGLQRPAPPKPAVPTARDR